VLPHAPKLLAAVLNTLL